MTRRERVGIAEVRIAEAPSVLVAYGLGSCLGIALYDPEARLGGLAHALLPAPLPGHRGDRGNKFVDAAIEFMVAELTRHGARRERLGAKVVGGAHMFEPPQANGAGIGARNAQSAREVLKAMAIPLLAEDVGGSHGRTVEFELATGALRIRSTCHDDVRRAL